MLNSKEVLGFKAKTSIQAMALFTDCCKRKGVVNAIRWFEANADDFQKEELAYIVRQLLYAVKVDCDDPDTVLLDLATQADEDYEQAYDQEGING